MDTNVTDRPVIDEAMTTAELFAACQVLAKKAGPQTYAHVGVSVDRYGSGKPVWISIEPGGATADRFSGLFLSFSEAFAAAEAWIATHAVVRRETVIRKMALAIIDLTDSGQCTAQMLRSREFTQGEIEEFHEAACVRAGEMCAGSPFVVVMDNLP